MGRLSVAIIISCLIAAGCKDSPVSGGDERPEFTGTWQSDTSKVGAWRLTITGEVGGRGTGVLTGISTLERGWCKLTEDHAVRFTYDTPDLLLEWGDTTAYGRMVGDSLSINLEGHDYLLGRLSFVGPINPRLPEVGGIYEGSGEGVFRREISGRLVETPGPEPVTLRLSQDGCNLEGTVSGDGYSHPVNGALWDLTPVTFLLWVNDNRPGYTLGNIDGTISGNQITGRLAIDTYAPVLVRAQMALERQ